MTEHDLFYYPYASFTDAQVPLLKVAALYFDKLVMRDRSALVGTPRLLRSTRNLRGGSMTDSEAVPVAVTLKPDADYLAPDGSEIRLLPAMKGGGLCHCTLPVGKTSAPMSHRQVEEIWSVASGEGEVWHKNAAGEETVRVCAGSSLTIPPRTAFQFRNTGDSPLCILIVTMPPWPGPQEAEKAGGVWPVTAGTGAESGSASIVAELGVQSRERSEDK